MRKPRQIDHRLQALGLNKLFQRRLEEVVEGLGGPTKIEEQYGISREALLKWRKGQSRAPFFDLALLCSESGRSIDWLAGLQPSDGAGAEFARIPQLDVRASAGGGAIAISEEPGDVVAFRIEFLRRMGISPLRARTMFATGDSMEPTIRDGDLLLVDESIDRVVDHGIYVVVYQGMVLVKRVQLRLDGTLVLMSDNARYKEELVEASDLADLSIAGRVRWFGRTI